MTDRHVLEKLYPPLTTSPSTESSRPEASLRCKSAVASSSPLSSSAPRPMRCYHEIFPLTLSLCRNSRPTAQSGFQDQNRLASHAIDPVATVFAGVSWIPPFITVSSAKHRIGFLERRIGPASHHQCYPTALRCTREKKEHCGCASVCEDAYDALRKNNKNSKGMTIRVL